MEGAVDETSGNLTARIVRLFKHMGGLNQKYGAYEPEYANALFEILDTIRAHYVSWLIWRDSSSR